jgi:hypothetical protein
MGFIEFPTELSPEFVENMFEYERYVHDVNDHRLLTAYLARVMLRIEQLKVKHGIS